MASANSKRSLNGKVVAFLESRMSSEMGALIERHGGVPYSAPVMQEIYSEDSPEVRELISDTCEGRVDALLLLTGVGTQALVQTAASMGREQEFLRSLEGLTIIARSPKPARVLRQHQIHIDLMPPEPYTSADLLASLGDLDLRDKTVAIQRYGGPNNFLVQSLAERGARVREVTLYTWGLPEDITPVLGLIEDLVQGKVDALAFTSQPQVGNLLTIAQEAGRTEALTQSLRGPVVVASVGPVCSRRLREAELPVDVEPEHPHMGNLVLAVADYFQSGQLAVG